MPHKNHGNKVSKKNGGIMVVTKILNPLIRPAIFWGQAWQLGGGSLIDSYKWIGWSFGRLKGSMLEPFEWWWKNGEIYQNPQKIANSTNECKVCSNKKSRQRWFSFAGCWETPKLDWKRFIFPFWGPVPFQEKLAVKFQGLFFIQKWGNARVNTVKCHQV